ncbi:MAG: hypothetical protein OSB07_08385, partial [Dehalococcoidia bacterium]|nr:hypothetical protein [Dehalococcoidia bacterium]
MIGKCLFSGRPDDGILIRNNTFLSTGQREQQIMVKSKPKREKTEETTEQFVARINAEARKRNGLKQNLKGARR